MDPLLRTVAWVAVSAGLGICLLALRRSNPEHRAMALQGLGICATVALVLLSDGWGGGQGRSSYPELSLVFSLASGALRL